MGGMLREYSKNSEEIIMLCDEHGGWFHTGFNYGVCNEVFGRVIRKNNKNPSFIYKVKAHTPGDLSRQIDYGLKVLGVSRLEKVQIAENPNFSLFSVDSPFYREMQLLIDQGKVGEYLIESFWEYSDNVSVVINEKIISGIIFYWNIFQREVSNELLAIINDSKKKVVALRGLAGGENIFNDKTMWAVPYWKKYYLNAVLNKCNRKLDSMSFHEMKIAYLNSQESITHIVSGSTKISRVRSLIGAIEENLTLPIDVVRKIDDLQKRSWSKTGIKNGINAKYTIWDKFKQKYLL